MKKLLGITMISLLMTLNVLAQTGAKIQFEKTRHDFGTFQETDGIQHYQFKFTNTGNVPLVINDVKASCGCTTPNWTKEPIPPKKSGFVKVSFDPKNRPGPFNKSITVSSNTKPASTILYIVGKVIERKRTEADFYKFSLNGLKMKSNHFAMTKMTVSEVKSEPLELYNTTTKPMVVEFDRIPKYIEFEKTKIKLAPRAKTYIEVTYNAKAKKDYGFLTDDIPVIVNGQRNGNGYLRVSAEIYDDFSKMTEKQKNEAGRMTFEKKIHDMGTVKQRGKGAGSVEFDFPFQNTGNTALKIRKIAGSCDCVDAYLMPSKKDIAPNGKAKIHVVFNPRYQNGKQLKTISVITNSPKQPKVTLRVKGMVVK